MRLVKISLATAFLSLSVTAASAATLVNGGFEDPDLNGFGFRNSADVPGWTMLNGAIEFWYPGFERTPGYEGNQFIELNSNDRNVNGTTRKATLYQDVTGIAAGSRLDFAFAHRGRRGNDDLRFSLIDITSGTTLFSKDYTGLKGLWTLNDSAALPAIVALGGDVRLQFESLQGGTLGNLLDDVSLSTTPVPLPAGFLLLASGLLGFGLLRRRRHTA
jgi:hypothetical protein